ncbi:hypothetical protein [Streptomyces griseorubiginosus]|uniref:hypothetical protein n=1 Tax=Streptomyces griseorubiginosus TaxID=67304 RepID=UPI00076C7CF2|nr:hypothetical protein [Streptomyces griseorubiginosus]KUM78941.1 hypothetical protein AQI84_08030 [Streptomyces griseorubiginosus]
MRASPAVRSLRAAVFAALCVLLAAGGHTLATGMTPPVWAQAVGFLPVFAAGWLLGGRERSLGAIGAATLTSQTGLHLAFGAAGSHSRATRQGMAIPHMTMPHMVTPHMVKAHMVTPHMVKPHMAMPHTVKAHMAMHGMRMIYTTTAPPHAVTPHATAAHLSAALLLTWWLRRGEAALWSLLRRSVALVPGLAAWWRGYGEPAAPDLASPAADHGTRTPRPLLLRHTVHRRGPPTTIPYAI